MNVLRSFGERITGRGAEIWPEVLGRKGSFGQLWQYLIVTNTEHIFSILHPSECADVSE